MSRSIHSTRNKFWREARFQSADMDAQRDRLDAISAELQTKRRIKSRVRSERGSPDLSHLPPAIPDAIPISIIDQGERIHFPASLADLRAVMKRLPAGALNGLCEVRLCLGKEYQEEQLNVDQRTNADRDPWLGRAGVENLPGVFGGKRLGTYWYPPCRIDLYAYVYDPAMPEKSVWEMYLRLRMLVTFVHEVAHHEDYMQRVARGRWRADDQGKQELFAERAAADWVRRYVVPYLEETYPDAVGELNAWIAHHGGIVMPLALLAGEWRWGSDGKVVHDYLFSAMEAFESLAENVHQRQDCRATRLGFARQLHYGEFYAEALHIIGRVLDELPSDPEALTLKADIFEHQERYREAEALARRVVDREPEYAAAWQVLTDVYEVEQDWVQLRLAAEKGIAASQGSQRDAERLLARRAHANLELGRHTDLAADLEALSQTTLGTSDAALFKALLLLKSGNFREALDVAEAQLAVKGTFGYRRTILLAARFEASQKLGQPAVGGKLTADTLEVLRRHGYSTWAEQLKTDHKL